MKKNKHIGSSFDSFLEEAGILEEVNAAAVKKIIERRMKEYVRKRQIKKITIDDKF